MKLMKIFLFMKLMEKKIIFSEKVGNFHFIMPNF